MGWLHISRDHSYTLDIYKSYSQVKTRLTWFQWQLHSWVCQHFVPSSLNFHHAWEVSSYQSHMHWRSRLDRILNLHYRHSCNWCSLEQSKWTSSVTSLQSGLSTRLNSPVNAHSSHTLVSQHYSLSLKLIKLLVLSQWDCPSHLGQHKTKRNQFNWGQSSWAASHPSSNIK